MTAETACSLNVPDAPDAPDVPEPQRPLSDILDEVSELSARIQAATYRMLTLIRELDERADWYARGARSCAHYLAWHIGIDLGTAREKVRVAHALAGLPAVSDSFRRGKISYSKVRAITRIATPDTEIDLLDIAEAGNTSHVEKLVRYCRGVTKGLELEKLDKTVRQQQRRSVSYYPDEDGMLIVSAKLTPEQAAIFCKSIDRFEVELFVRKAKRAVSSVTPTPTPRVLLLV